MRILFDKNVPAGVRTFLSGHYVRTFVQMHWHPQLENGDLLELAEFDVVVTSDQNIQYQQNLKGRKLSLVVLGSEESLKSNRGSVRVSLRVCVFSGTRL